MQRKVGHGIGICISVPFPLNLRLVLENGMNVTYLSDLPNCVYTHAMHYEDTCI